MKTFLKKLSVEEIKDLIKAYKAKVKELKRGR